MRRIWQRILLSLLLIGSVVASAASDQTSAPGLETVYHLAKHNKLSPRSVSEEFFAVLAAQRLKEVAQAQFELTKIDLTQSEDNVGLFHHMNNGLREQLQGRIDIAEAAYFAAQQEWQIQLSQLNQILNAGFGQLRTPDVNFLVQGRNSEAQEVLQLRQQLLDQKRNLQLYRAAFDRANVSVEAVIAQEQKLRQLQTQYWSKVRVYFTDVIKNAPGFTSHQAQLLDQDLYNPVLAQQRLNLVKKPNNPAAIKKHTAAIIKKETRTAALKPKNTAPVVAQIELPQPLQTRAWHKQVPVAVKSQPQHKKVVAKPKPIIHHQHNKVAAKKPQPAHQLVAHKSKALTSHTIFSRLHFYILPSPRVTMKLPDPISTTLQYVS